MDSDRDYRKTMLTLPPEVGAAFESMETPERNGYAVALRNRGWTLQSISDAAGITRERVRQIVSRDDWPEPTDAPLPEPPEHVRPTPRTFIEPDPAKLARALELKPAAQAVRSNGGKNRAEAEEYTALIADMHLQDGVTLYRLAKRLGVTHGALRFRLARYGYKLPQTGSSKVYTPINPENRAKRE